MHGLTLAFGDGRVRGKGHDCVGPFIFEGDYDDRGHVRLVKCYLGRHQVLYHGLYDGEGTIHGTWMVEGLWSGAFALAPARRPVDPSAPILAIDPGP